MGSSDEQGIKDSREDFMVELKKALIENNIPFRVDDDGYVMGSMGSVSLIRTAANDPQYAARVILADQNQDGEINVADVLLLQRRLLSGERYPPQAALEPVAPGTAGGMERQTSFAALIDYLIHPAHAVPGDPGQLLYVHVDHLGTPVAMTDEQGVKVWSAVYDPFGKATPNEDPDGNGQAVTLNVRFPGQYYDQETGLHYNYFRYYDPNMGRYLTSDPIGLQGGLNTYSYAGENPIILTDPLGLLPTMPLPDFGPLCGSGAGARNVPDRYGSWNFNEACRDHDECYATCGAGKDECDNIFLVDMLQECSRYGAPGLCTVLAHGYYRAVRTIFAQMAYNAAQEQACDDGECK